MIALVISLTGLSLGSTDGAIGVGRVPIPGSQVLAFRHTAASNSSMPVILVVVVLVRAGCLRQRALSHIQNDQKTL